MRRNQRGQSWNRDTKSRLENAWERKWAAPALIAHHRQALAARPDDHAARYLLANCLYDNGQRDAGEAEWRIVAPSGDAEWAEIVREARVVMING